MKKIKILALTALTAALSQAVFAEEGMPIETPQKAFTFSIVADAAYYPYAVNIANPAHVPANFSPIAGAYDGLEARVTGHAIYAVPTPMGEHWMVKDSKLEIDPWLELSPVSVMPGLGLTWTPVPFLMLNGGAQAGTGWSLGNFVQGTGFFNGTDAYTEATPFKDWFIKAWMQATFQFDTGAIWKSDWTHVQMMFTYQAYYSMLTGAANGEVWKWQGAGNKANGWQEYMCAILAYQMPVALSRVGVMFESEGHYNSADYKYTNFQGDFKEIGLSPFLQFSFTKKDTLLVLFNISSRRSFEEGRIQSDGNKEPLLTTVGREWYFKRLALRYIHNF